MLSTLKMLQGAAEAARVRSMQDRRLLFQGTVHSAQSSYSNLTFKPPKPPPVSRSPQFCFQKF